MCGLVGFIRSSSRETSDLGEIVTRMMSAIEHRGPDGGGSWVDSASSVAIGHRRLSILDLSPHGHQPMISDSDRFVIAFNGEIYNHNELRLELDQQTQGARSSEAQSGSIAWRGHSDTEVMLNALECWGVEKALRKFNGMFAFALWDKQERLLHLARDRFGEKPLYYGLMGDTFLFGSELKALKVHPEWDGTIDRGALALYMRHTYVPAPHSIYTGIKKLLPGHILSIPFKNARVEIPESCAYWSAKMSAEAGSKSPFDGDETAAVRQLHDILDSAVGLRMSADVPLGAFLSGGIDSSLVVALMQAQSSRPVKTFSIGFEEEQYNEAQHAKLVAAHLGTEHTELYVTPAEAIAVIPKLPTIYDEPFADASQIPTFLVSQMTREHVTVALSGDGGDELFGGYNRYFWGREIWNKVGWIPSSVRGMVSRSLLGITPSRLDHIAEFVSPALPSKMNISLAGDKLHKLAGILACDTPETMYRGLVSFWEPESVLLGASEHSSALTDIRRQAALPDFTDRMMFLDIVSYLPDDILVKVDRASMAVSLEARVPLLDHRIAEFAFSLPMAMKIRGAEGKWPLREVLDQHVPKKIIDRPKMGFGVPIDEWLRGPLRDWAESYLNEPRLEQEGFFDPRVVGLKWKEHIAGKRNWASQLWCVLMFQTWFEAQDA